MSATLMQPSHDEIQREVENLRDIKRRSTLQGGPGVLILDPDLPTPGAQAAAAQASYWGDDSSSDSHSNEDASSSESASDDPFHLFWVPANKHPEIDPAQFRAFLKEHASPDEGILERPESFSSAPLGRKKSMLSRQYRPTENDGVEDERVVLVRKSRSSLYANSGPQLTIKDLERLDELAEEASKSSDPTKLRSVLRRSLSMNLSPSVIDAMPDPGEDADAPIIVPRPGQILRRAARTKIRRHGQTGEGAHRFNATRRGAGAKRDTPPPVSEPRTSSDLSTSDHSDAEPPQHRPVLSNESLGEDQHSVRPESYSAEAFIFDSYTRDDIKEDEIKPVSPPLSTHPLPRRLSPPPPSTSRLEPESIPPLPPMPSIQPALASPPLQHPLPQRASSLVSPPSVEAPPSRSPSPVSTTHSEIPYQMRPESRPVQTQSISPHSAPPALPGFDPRREKEKDKRGLFKWGGSEKKLKKEQREKEKDAGFFGSLFGSKKRHEEPPSSSGLVSGREAAAALLGESKSYVPPASPQPPSVNNFSRYPIHVERAIYRLSHIKLANPRRALYEQVLISNLMFWYLGVINKTQQQSPSSPPQGQQRQTPTGEAQAVTSSPGPGSPKESEEKEREENAWTGIEQTEKEREPKLAPQGQGQMQAQAQGQGQTQTQQTQQTQSRRGSLTKGAPSNVNSRRAEQPVRGPQYDMQHRAMEVEYGTTFVGARPPAGAGYAASPGAASSAGPTTPSIPMTMLGGTGQSSSTPQLHGIGNTMTSAAVPLSPTLSNSPSWRSRSPPPPAGAALRYATPPPPVPMPVQIPSQNSIPGQSSSTTPAAHSQASPFSMSAQQPQQGYVDTRPPMRSMSANATQPLGPRGPGRKVLSAHAVLPPGARRPRTADNLVARDIGEDVPLALWQQQQQQQQQQQSLLNQQPRRR